MRLRGKLTSVEIPLFLAKRFGTYLLFLVVFFVVRGELIGKVIEEFFAIRSMLFLSGLLALTVEIAMLPGGYLTF